MLSDGDRAGQWNLGIKVSKRYQEKKGCKDGALSGGGGGACSTRKMKKNDSNNNQNNLSSKTDAFKPTL